MRSHCGLQIKIVEPESSFLEDEAAAITARVVKLAMLEEIIFDVYYLSRDAIAGNNFLHTCFYPFLSVNLIFQVC